MTEEQASIAVDEHGLRRQIAPGDEAPEHWTTEGQEGAEPASTEAPKPKAKPRSG